MPLAGLAVADTLVVRAGAGVTRFALEVAEPGQGRFPDHVVDFGN
jgi:hypothetical protein